MEETKCLGMLLGHRPDDLVRAGPVFTESVELDLKSRSTDNCLLCLLNDLDDEDVGAEFDIPPSTLSHHLDKLKNEDLVKVRRESTYLWYSTNTEALQELLGFLYAECCTRNQAVESKAILQACK